MTHETDARQIELTMDDALNSVKAMEVFQRLVKNPDFQEIIEKGYFEQEAVRLVGALASPALAEEHNQTEILKDISGIGRLQQYFYAIVQKGQTAEGAITSYKQELELIRQEEAAE